MTDPYVLGPGPDWHPHYGDPFCPTCRRTPATTKETP